MPTEVNQEARNLAKVLWDYHCVDVDPTPSDFILALGSHDSRVASRAAELMLQGLAPLLVTSGGLGKVTSGMWVQNEGERFAEIAVAAGVPAHQIMIEPEARNTGDNITKTRDLLERNNIKVSTGILVTKPYMMRRAYAAAAKQWADVEWQVAAPKLSLDEYPDQDVTEIAMIELMVGDLQRMEIYATKGFQIPQDIPSDVWDAYNQLVALGFDRFVIRE